MVCLVERYQLQQVDNLTELNLKVAAIAGWTDITVWQPERNLAIKTYEGVNKASPEIGSFVPNYAEDLNAIFALFKLLSIEFHLTNEHQVVSHNYFQASSLQKESWIKSLGETPAIALCKLLIAINPQPIIEASFG